MDEGLLVTKTKDSLTKAKYEMIRGRNESRMKSTQQLTKYPPSLRI